MYKKIILALVTFSLSSVPAMAVDMPKAYKSCKKCHGLPGETIKKRNKYPDLAESKMTFEQFTMQVKKGSKWAGRPPKMEGYENRKMPPLKKKTDAQIKEIFDFIATFKK